MCFLAGFIAGLVIGYCTVLVALTNLVTVARARVARADPALYRRLPFPCWTALPLGLIPPVVPFLSAGTSLGAS